MRDGVSEKPSFLHCVLCSRASFARNRLGFEAPWNERDRKKYSFFPNESTVYIYRENVGRSKKWREKKDRAKLGFFNVHDPFSDWN